MIYDLIIIGAGPAGITAAVYAARKRLDLLVITRDIGGQAAWSGDIENYTGYQFVSGPELVAKFEEHMRTYRIPIRENEEVTALERQSGVISVTTTKARYEARAVIVAAGKISRELGVPGENEFRNKGLTYCATCDGPLFAGMDVAVIGGGNSALDAALQLMRIARRVHLVNNTPRLGGDVVMREKVEKSAIVTVHTNATVRAITGEKMVSGITIAVDGREEVLPVRGVFIEIGLVPNAGFTKGIEKNESGEIVVNGRNETNLPGVFAAGDVTDCPEKQIIIAAGEGSKAALSAFRYLNSR